MFEIDVENPRNTIETALTTLNCSAAELARRIGCTPSQLSLARNKADRIPAALLKKLENYQRTLEESEEPAIDVDLKQEIIIEALQSDDSIQQRVQHINQDTVQNYVEAAQDSWPFPPVIVFRDGDGKHWLADGFHRVQAALRLSLEQIPADIRPGTRDDAILAAVGANAEHGLPRTNADKRKAIETMLDHPEYSTWTDRRIAEACQVDHKTVGAVRRDLKNPVGNSPVTISSEPEPEPQNETSTGEFPSEITTEPEPEPKPEPTKRTGKDGRTIDVAGIQKSNKKRKPKPDPMPKKAAQQALHRFAGACAELRKVEPEPHEQQQVIKLATELLCRYLPEAGAELIAATLADLEDAAGEVVGNA